MCIEREGKKEQRISNCFRDRPEYQNRNLKLGVHPFSTAETASGDEVGEKMKRASLRRDILVSSLVS